MDTNGSAINYLCWDLDGSWYLLLHLWYWQNWLYSINGSFSLLLSW
jgi:hypothetical protein